MTFDQRQENMHLSLPAARLTADEALPSGSPFVSMTPFHRMLMVGLLSAYLLWIAVQNVTVAPSTTSAMVLLALTVNFALLLLPILFAQPSFGWFHPLVFGTILAFTDHLRRSGVYAYGLQWHVALPGWSPAELNQLVAAELWLSAIGTGAVYLGFLLCPRFGVPKLRFYQPTHLGRKVLLTVLFAASVCLVFLQTRGGITAHILSWGRGRRTELAGAAYWGFFVQLGIVACLSWLALDRSAIRRPLFWVCTVISLICSFLFGGSRSTLIYYLVMGLIVWLIKEQRISFTKLFLVILTSLFLIGTLGAFRTSTFTGEIDWSVFTSPFASGTSGEESALWRGAEEASVRSGEGFGAYPILALVPEQVDPLNGSSYLAVLALPIPRVLWSDKPGLVGGRVGATFFNTSAGIPPGPIGEAYWNFGVPGVLLAFLLFGMFHRWLTQAFCQYAHRPAAIVLYGVTLFQFAEPSSSGIVTFAITLTLTVLFLRSIGAIGFKSTDRFRK